MAILTWLWAEFTNHQIADHRKLLVPAAALCWVKMKCYCLFLECSLVKKCVHQKVINIWGMINVVPFIEKCKAWLPHSASNYQHKHFDKFLSNDTYTCVWCITFSALLQFKSCALNWSFFLIQTAILIPFRNREKHLLYFLYYMLPALQRQQIMFRIYVVHQVSCDKKQLLKVFITSDWPNNSYGGSIQCFSVYITIQKMREKCCRKLWPWCLI